MINDNLSDLDIHVRPWFHKYYIPYLQKQETLWREMLPQLIANSQKRLEMNKNYKIFQEKLKHTIEDNQTYGSNDLQMEEAVNVVKDMILLYHK